MFNTSVQTIWHTEKTNKKKTISSTHQIYHIKITSHNIHHTISSSGTSCGQSDDSRSIFEKIPRCATKSHDDPGLRTKLRSCRGTSKRRTSLTHTQTWHGTGVDATRVLSPGYDNTTTRVATTRLDRVDVSFWLS